MNFASRIGNAVDAEKRVLGGLKAAGYMAYPFGQGMLPYEFREALRQYANPQGRPSLVRWFPDIVAARMPILALLDVKTDSGKTPNYSIEISALEACEAMQNGFFTPSWFIFPDLRVLTPKIVRKNCKTGNFRGNGTGTPFVIVEKSYAVSIDVAWADWNS
jgi:hypothetical protein